VEIKEIIELGKKLHSIPPLNFMNIFLRTKKVRSELSHSNILAYLLDHTEAHQAGSKYSDLFIEIVNKRLKPDKQLPLQSWEVYRESQNIDILMINKTNNIAIIIENKVDAIDQEKQLERYYRAIHTDANYNVQLIYLTLLGDSPSAESLGALSLSQVLCISYIGEIKTWIEMCMDTYKGNEESYFGLKHYLESIIVMTENEKIQKEIRDIVFEKKGIDFDIHRSIEKAGMRYCHYMFFEKLKAEFKKHKICFEETSNGLLNDIINQDEYGLFLPLVNNKMKFGISFENDDSKSDLYLGVFNTSDQRSAKEKDKYFIELFNKSKKYKKWEWIKTEWWYLVVYSQDVENLDSYKNIKDGTIKHWEQWATEAAPVFMQEYNELKEYLTL